MAEGSERVTEEQANAALQQLINPDESEQVEESAAEEVAEASAEEPEATEEQPEESGDQPDQPGRDDVESLDERLEAKAKELEERYKAQLDAIQHRNTENERILRERYVKKSSAAERALRALQKARSEEGADVGDIDDAIRKLEETMNQASASYTPPEQTGVVEDHALVLNNFLNEQRLTDAEAGEFGSWLRTDANTALSPVELSVADRDLDGFLRIAYPRFREGKREAQKAQERTDAVAAVKSVKRTQREAARAASATPASPKRTPTGQKTADKKPMTPSDVSALVRQSVEQYH